MIGQTIQPITSYGEWHVTYREEEASVVFNGTKTSDKTEYDCYQSAEDEQPARHQHKVVFQHLGQERLAYEDVNRNTDHTEDRQLRQENMMS